MVLPHGTPALYLLFVANSGSRSLFSGHWAVLATEEMGIEKYSTTSKMFGHL